MTHTFYAALGALAIAGSSTLSAQTAVPSAVRPQTAKPSASTPSRTVDKTMTVTGCLKAQDASDAGRPNSTTPSGPGDRQQVRPDQRPRRFDGHAHPGGYGSGNARCQRHCARCWKAVRADGGCRRQPRGPSQSPGARDGQAQPRDARRPGRDAGRPFEAGLDRQPRRDASTWRTYGTDVAGARRLVGNHGQQFVHRRHAVGRPGQR